MVDFAKSFTVLNGLSLDDINGVFAGETNPSIEGEIAELGSLYLQSNGQIWYKFGSENSDWRELGLPVGLTALVGVNTELKVGGKYMSTATSLLSHSLPDNPEIGASIQIAHARIGDAETNNITIDSGSNTFAEDGSSSFIIDVNGGFVEIVWNGTNWFGFSYNGTT